MLSLSLVLFYRNIFLESRAFDDNITFTWTVFGWWKSVLVRRHSLFLFKFQIGTNLRVKRNTMIMLKYVSFPGIANQTVVIGKGTVVALQYSELLHWSQVITSLLSHIFVVVRILERMSSWKNTLKRMKAFVIGITSTVWNVRGRNCRKKY